MMRLRYSVNVSMNLFQTACFSRTNYNKLMRLNVYIRNFYDKWLKLIKALKRSCFPHFIIYYRVTYCRLTSSIVQYMKYIFHCNFAVTFCRKQIILLDAYITKLVSIYCLYIAFGLAYIPLITELRR